MKPPAWVAEQEKVNTAAGFQRIDRAEAGRTARNRGQRAEYQYAQHLRDLGCTVHRVKRGPYDLIWYDGEDWGMSQVKSYLLPKAELNAAKRELAAIVAPPGTIREVVMKNRKKGKAKVGEPKWVRGD